MSARVQPKPTPDIILLATTLILLGLGVDMVYSASFVVAQSEYLVRQVILAGMGLVVMIALTVAGYHWLERLSVPIMTVAVICLIAVLIPGVSADKYGAHRWLGMQGLQEFQPSELTKLALVIYMSAWLARKGHRVKEIGRGFVPFATILLLVTVLIMAEPDMGTAVVVAVTATFIFFVAGANLLHFLVIGLAGVVGFAFLVVAAGYRQDRLTAFLNPWQDSLGTGYHTVQTRIALGWGGVRGLGRGPSGQRSSTFLMPIQMLSSPLSVRSWASSVPLRSFSCSRCLDGEALPSPCERRTPLAGCWRPASRAVFWFKLSSTSRW